MKAEIYNIGNEFIVWMGDFHICRRTKKQAIRFCKWARWDYKIVN